MTNTIRSGCIGWYEMSGVVCDKNVPEVLTNKIYDAAIRPAITFDGEWWAILKYEQNQLDTTEMKMFRQENAWKITIRSYQKCYHP